VASHDAIGWKSESWKIEADRDEVIRTYSKWHPSLSALFAATESCYKWALYDRDPLPSWSRGPVTLIGDAAHAMLPFLAQGACMAVEDSYALVTCLCRHPDSLAAALSEYEALRKPRTSRVQIAARNRVQINNLSSPFARFRRDLGYTLRKLISPSRHTYKIEWIYDYDVRAV
jgi:salicylate hydroxylase